MGVILTLHSALFTRHCLPVELRLLIEKYMIEKLDNDSIEDTLLQYKYGDDIDREFVTMLYGNIEWWDTSAVTDMSSLFMLQNHFNTDITNWDVSFNQPLDAWDVTNVEDMKDMFTDCSSFKHRLPPFVNQRRIHQPFF